MPRPDKSKLVAVHTSLVAVSCKVASGVSTRTTTVLGHEGRSARADAMDGDTTTAFVLIDGPSDRIEKPSVHAKSAGPSARITRLSRAYSFAVAADEVSARPEPVSLGNDKPH